MFLNWKAFRSTGVKSVILMLLFTFGVISANAQPFAYVTIGEWQQPKPYCAGDRHGDQQRGGHRNGGKYSLWSRHHP